MFEKQAALIARALKIDAGLTDWLNRYTEVLPHEAYADVEEEQTTIGTYTKLAQQQGLTYRGLELFELQLNATLKFFRQIDEDYGAKP